MDDIAEAIELLTEKLIEHSDENSPSWNDCGTPETDCDWCARARAWIARQNDEEP